MRRTGQSRAVRGPCRYVFRVPRGAEVGYVPEISSISTCVAPSLAMSASLRWSSVIWSVISARYILPFELIEALRVFRSREVLGTCPTAAVD